MMAFTHPWALLLALPAAWLLWRSRRPAMATHAVANLFLWMDSGTAAAEPQRDRRAAPPWLVWLQAVALVALAVAIAGPTRPGPQPTAALIIDASASMQARDGTASRAELAKAAAERWRGERASKTRTTIVEASSLINLIEAIESAGRQTDGAVTVITDLPAPVNAAALGIAWQQVGTPVDNIGITALSSLGDSGAILEVTNFGVAAKSLVIDIADGATTRTERVNVDAGGVRGFIIEPGPERTITAAIRVDGNTGNALASDDRRSLDLRTLPPVNIILAHDNSLVAAAMLALPDANVIEAGSVARGRAVWVCAMACAAPEGAPTLVFTGGGTIPGIERHEASGVRSVAVSVDLGSSAWPLTPAFPVFIADSIDWLANNPAAYLDADRIAAIGESNTRSASAPSLTESPLTSRAGGARELWWPLALFAVGGALVDLAVRRRAWAIRGTAALAIVIALGGVTLPIGGSDRAAVILVDSSASVAGNVRAATDRVRAETARVAGNDHIGIVRFGGTSTDIASGIRAARATLPPGGDRRILLLTDGQQTSGDAAAEARAAGAAGVAIDVAAIDSRAPGFVDRFDAPVSSHAGAPVTLRIAIKGRAREILGLTVSRDGRALDTRRVALDDEGGSAVTITDTPATAGVAFYHATLSDEQLGVPLSESGAAVTVTGRSRVLLISERRAFRQAIGTGPFDVVEMEPAAAPDTRDGLIAFSAIVIDAVAPHRLSERQLNAIATAVSIDGAGLLLLGGPESLDAADFTAGAFADALPVDFTALPHPPSASTSMALLVDISGSMASTSDGVTKISAARDAIVRAMAITPPGDAIKVIAFAAEPTTLIGPNDARDAVSIAEKLKALVPSGRTALAPAVGDAVAWLKSTPNRRRRLLLVTDGKTSVSDADATRRAVLGEGIEVSVITIGSDAEREWLSALSSATGGRALFPERLGDLAREVAREAGRGATGREVTELFVVRGGAHPLAPPDPAPALGGYIAGRLREGATAAWKSRSDDAVLAAWPRGLGRVAVFSADFGGPWSAPLRGWPSSMTFWPRAVHWLARSSDANLFDAGLTFANNGPRVVVELPDSGHGQALLPSVRVTLAGPSGQTSAFALHAVSATRFEAPATLGEAGDYRATIAVTDATGLESRATRGWFWTGDLESQSRGRNTELINEIARASGGRVLPSLGSPMAPADSLWSAPRARGHVNAVPWLMLAALALLSFNYIRRAAEI